MSRIQICLDNRLTDCGVLSDLRTGRALLPEALLFWFWYSFLSEAGRMGYNALGHYATAASFK
jgi:hypothetical protein